MGSILLYLVLGLAELQLKCAAGKFSVYTKDLIVCGE